MTLFSRLFVYVLLVGLASCAREPPEIVIAGPTMGTTYTVKIAAPRPTLDPHDLRLLIERSLERIDETMSGYREDSEVSRFNALHSDDWFEISPELAHVVTAALEVSAASGGAFDVTVAPVVKAWGFGASDGPPARLPDAAALAELQRQVGYEKLHARLSPPALRKDEPSLSVDLNGIAPGYAVDLIAAQLEARGIANFMIDVGGEIRARGRNGAGEKWRIAVESPKEADSAPVAVIGMDGVALATSGEYRNVYERDGVRYSHTIDPRTAHPIRYSVSSVVVVHPEAMYADAWATALNVLGADSGLRLAEHLQLPVMFIVKRGDSFTSKISAPMRNFVVMDRLSGSSER
jgi:thiamine biosynthesis lipoprotein